MPVPPLIRGRRGHPAWSSHGETHFIFSPPLRYTQYVHACLTYPLLDLDPHEPTVSTADLSLTRSSTLNATRRLGR
jgi:hypothetical protein